MVELHETPEADNQDSPETQTRADPVGSGGARKAKRTVGHTVRRVILATTVVLALVVGLGSVYLYNRLNGNLQVQDVSTALGDDRPDKVEVVGGEPLNILVMGSDARDCPGCKIDGELGGNASDTTIILHLSADRTHAYGISIPRDSLVTRPPCGKKDEIAGGPDQMWNAAFSVGGPACTMRQVEATTGIFIDHYIVVNFGGFTDMVNAVGGVPVCLTSPINDTAHNIRLPAGHQVLEGDEALSFVRVRYTDFKDKSDLSRIRRQQAFIAALINKVVSAGTLARPDRLLPFLDASTKSLTVDPGLNSVTKLGDLALQIKDIGLDKVRFVTVPWTYDRRPGFEYRVQWLPEVKKLWQAVIDDQDLPAKLSATAISASRPPGQTTGSGTATEKQTKEQREADANAGLCS